MPHLICQYMKNSSSSLQMTVNKLCYRCMSWLTLIIFQFLQGSNKNLLESWVLSHVASSKRADTLICHTTMRRNPINFLYNSGHVTLWCVEVGPVANAREGSTQEHDQASVRYWFPVHDSYQLINYIMLPAACETLLR